MPTEDPPQIAPHPEIERSPRQRRFRRLVSRASRLCGQPKGRLSARDGRAHAQLRQVQGSHTLRSSVGAAATSVTVASSPKGYCDSTTTVACAAATIATTGTSDATTTAGGEEAASASTALCANLGQPCGKLVMQQGKCDTPKKLAV